MFQQRPVRQRSSRDCGELGNYVSQDRNSLFDDAVEGNLKHLQRGDEEFIGFTDPRRAKTIVPEFQCPKPIILYYFFLPRSVTDFCTSFDVIGWLNGRASVFGTEGYGFESRVGLQYFYCFSGLFFF